MAPGAKEAIRLCKERDWLVFVVTNPSCVARRVYGKGDVRRQRVAWMGYMP